MRDSLSILMAAPDRRECDGVIFRETHALLVRVVSPRALEAFLRSTESREGDLTKWDRAQLRAQVSLFSALRLGKDADLRTYALLRAWLEEREASSRRGRIFGIDPTPTEDELKSRQEEILKSLKPPGRRNSVGEFLRVLTASVSGARFVPWWSYKERHIEVGVFCPTLRSALSCLLLAKAMLPEGAGICLACRKTFRRARPDQRYCSIRCGNRIRQRKKRKTLLGGQL